MRHRGIQESPNPQCVYENAACTSLSHVECTDSRLVGRPPLPAALPSWGTASGAGPRQPPRTPKRFQAEMSCVCPDGSGQDPSEMENGAESPDPYEG